MTQPVVAEKMENPLNKNCKKIILAGITCPITAKVKVQKTQTPCIKLCSLYKNAKLMGEIIINRK
jgi:hypothetical protein